LCKNEAKRNAQKTAEYAASGWPTGYAAAASTTTKPRFILACQWQQERIHHPTNKPHIMKVVDKCEVLFTTTYKTTIWHREQSWWDTKNLRTLTLRDPLQRAENQAHDSFHLFLNRAHNAVSSGRSGGAQAPERRSSPLAGGVG